MVTTGLLLCTTTMLALVKLTSAAAVGSADEGPADSLCQPSGTNASTTELLPILLKEENYDKLSGSAPLSNCASGLLCVDGSNVTLPHQLQLATGFGVRKAVIKFTLLPDGNISAVVTTHLSLLTAAIKQLSFRQFCCVDGVSNTVKCFMSELKFAPVQNRSAEVVDNNSSPVAGGSVTLTCPLISNPPGNYSWALDSGPFDRSNQRVLVLAPLKREHVGCYLCRLVSELDTKDVDTCSKVEAHCESVEKATFQVSAPQVEVEEGSTVTVNCSWSYKKLGRLNVDWWSPNGTEVDDISFHSDDFTCTGWLEMRIENFTAAKEGDYTCEDISSSSNTISPKAVRLTLAKPTNTTSVPLEYEAPSGPAAVIAGVSVSVVVLLVAMVTVVLVGLIVYWKQRPITIRKIPLDLPPREGFEYDVFLSYHDECDGLVRQLILGPLKAAGYAVCYHHDDFEPGVGIYDNIHSNMDKSRVAVLVLTESYTTSEYCIEEMHYAIRAVYSSRTRRLLPVAWRKEDVPKELGGWTYLEVKEGREGELADDIRDWLGDAIAQSHSDMP